MIWHDGAIQGAQLHTHDYRQNMDRTKSMSSTIIGKGRNMPQNNWNIHFECIVLQTAIL